jgi:sec-independent protein translocase protein TatB
MFGIGTGELLLVLVIALLVLGPERMPKLARDLGKTVNDLRKTSDELRSEFLNADRTLNAEKMLEVAARTAEKKSEDQRPPDAGATQADVVPAATETPPIPAEPEETAFDREVRLARERIDKGSTPS